MEKILKNLKCRIVVKYYNLHCKNFIPNWSHESLTKCGVQIWGIKKNAVLSLIAQFFRKSNKSIRASNNSYFYTTITHISVLIFFIWIWIFLWGCYFCDTWVLSEYSLTEKLKFKHLDEMLRMLWFFRNLKIWLWVRVPLQSLVWFYVCKNKSYNVATIMAKHANIIV